jgi:hypothetical protein
MDLMSNTLIQICSLFLGNTIYQSIIKKKYGYSIDGFGNYVEEKKTIEDRSDPKNMNSLLLRKTAVPVTVNKKEDQKNYTQISQYKPTGNLIYNTALLKKIENHNSNNK